MNSRSRSGGGGGGGGGGSTSAAGDASSDDQVDSQSRDGSEGGWEGEEEEEDPHCYMVWARLSNREHWWPAYRCEDSKLAPKKPPGKAIPGDEVELIAFYTGRKGANNQTKHLLAWVKSSDVRPYATFHFRDSVVRSRDFRDSVKEADADYLEYLKGQKDAATKSVAAAGSVEVTSTTDEVHATLMAQQSTSIIDQETIGYTVGHLPDGLKQTLQPGRKGFVVQMLEGKRQRRPNTVLMVDHADKTTPFYSHAVTDKSFMKAALAEEGAEVEANFMGDGIYYKGKIAHANRDGTFDIAYDDGDFEANKCASEIRRLANTETTSNATSAELDSVSTSEDSSSTATAGGGGPPTDERGNAPSASSSSNTAQRHIPTNLVQTLQPGRKGFVVEVLDDRRRRERIPTQNFYSAVKSAVSSSSSSSSSVTKTLKSLAKSSPSLLASAAPAAKAAAEPVPSSGKPGSKRKPPPSFSSSSQISQSTALSNLPQEDGKNRGPGRLRGSTRAKIEVAAPTLEVASSECGDFAKGDRVEGRWMRGEYFYPGRIAEVIFKHGRSLCNIEYDDGGYESEVEQRFIRREKPLGKRRALKKGDQDGKHMAPPSVVSTEGAPATCSTQEIMAFFDRRNTRIEFISSGIGYPIKLGSRGARATERFEKYRAATTVDEYIRFGGLRHDFDQDIKCGNLRLVGVDFSKHTKKPSTKAKMKPRHHHPRHHPKPSKMTGSKAPKRHQLLVKPMKKTSAKRARQGADSEARATSSKVACETPMDGDDADYHENHGYMYMRSQYDSYGGYDSEFGGNFDVICSVCKQRYDSRQQGVSREEYNTLSQSWRCSNCVLNHAANRRALVLSAAATYEPSVSSRAESERSEHNIAGGGGGGGLLGGDLGALLAAAEQLS